jgi:hypothetical protein
LILIWASQAYGQIIPITQDSINKDLTPETVDTKTVQFSDTGLDTEILYGAIDTQQYDHKTNKMHLWGNAFVNYKDKALKADYIILDMENNIAEAHYLKEMKNAEKPTFIDAGKEYKYNGLKYNFETEKGIVFDALFSESGFIIHGAKTKYVGVGGDKYNINDEIIYNQGATITTCDHPNPHFGFQANRMKVVTDKVAVVGPSNLKLGGVATPLWLPFGFFPLSEGKSSGFIFPQNYEFNSNRLGFGLKGFGWYFPVNDYLHFTLTGDLYTRGSYSLYLNSNYKKNYKYNGSFNLTFSNLRFEEEGLNAENVMVPLINAQQGYTINLRHTQDAKAHPFVTVGGSITIDGNNNQNRTNNSAASVLNNTYRSSFSYRNSLPGTPFQFSMGLNHNQNTRTNVVNLTLPDITLNMNTIYPFRRKNRGSNKEQWYENISFDYDVALKSLVQTTDTTLFSLETLEDFRTGVSHRSAVGFSTRIFKHFSIVPNASIESVQTINTIERRIESIVDRVDTELIIQGTDTIETLITVMKDTIIETNDTGFDTYTTYQAGVSLNTQLFGQMLFPKGWLRGVRHTMKPSISYNFAPDSRSQYVETVDFINSDRAPLTYTRFDGGPFGGPRLTDLQSQINFTVNNVLEIKHWSKKDSTEKKFKIFDNVNANMNYNFAADTLKWSRLTMSTTSRFFKGITQLTSSWTFDPYIEENNITVNKSVRSETGKLLRVERGTIRLASNLNFSKIKDFFLSKIKSDKDDDNSSSDRRANDKGDGEREGPPGGIRDGNEQQSLSDALSEFNKEDEPIIKPQKRELVSIYSLIENMSINHNVVYSITARDGVISSELATHSLDLRGSIPLSKNWSVGIGNIGYEFVQKRLTYPDISFIRQLHCWNMQFGWTPNRDTYTFFIGVSSSNLSFLKYNYGRNNIDGFFGR